MIVTATSWDEPPRLRHQIARLLEGDFNVVFVELPFESNWKKEKKIYKTSESMVVLSMGGFAKVVHFLRYKSKLIHLIIDRWVGRRLRGELNKLLGEDQRNIILINFQFDFTSIDRVYNWRNKIYFCNDDFTERVSSEHKKKILRSYERLVSQSMDKCFAVSNFLVNIVKSYNKNSELFLPAHNFDLQYSLSVSSFFEKSKSSINVGYMGFINNRLRLDWLLSIDQEEKFTLHLIGPNEDNVSFSSINFKNSRIKFIS